MSSTSTSPAASPARKQAGILPLRFERVGFEVGGHVLIADLDLQIDRGAPVVLLGPNGAGKSLTLRLAHGLIAPTTGRVHWREPDPTEARRRQAMVFAEAVLLRRTAARNIEHALRLRGVAGHERSARVARVLDRTGLSGLADRPARMLSSGERQRLSLARAWALEPDVLFLDEPTGSLDPAATASVEALIRALADEGRQIVMTTHDLGQARRIAGRVLFLHRGRLVEDAPAAQFFDAPASNQARAFLAGELVL
jgi:tungstate transport system ATP-binding protein